LLRPLWQKWFFSRGSPAGERPAPFTKEQPVFYRLHKRRLNGILPETVEIGDELDRSTTATRTSIPPPLLQFAILTLRLMTGKIAPPGAASPCRNPGHLSGSSPPAPQAG
jgi:hypothetical protein